jgi:hypothetical protein
MQLKVLADGNIGDASRVTLRDVADGANLVAAQQAVGYPNAHHEVRRCFALAAGAAENSSAIALGINTPGAEVGAEPFGRNRSVPGARERANLVEMLPSILGVLKTLDALRFGFFDFAHGWNSLSVKNVNQKQKTHVA